MSSLNGPPPSYAAATGIPAYTPLESSPPEQQNTQTQYANNNVYTVPVYPVQLQTPYNQLYYPPVQTQADLELRKQRNIRRKCVCATVTVVFFTVAILKFILYAYVRSI